MSKLWSKIHTSICWPISEAIQTSNKKDEKQQDSSANSDENKLQLKLFQKETLDITTFGSTQSTSETYEVVKLNLNVVKEDIRI